MAKALEASGFTVIQRENAALREMHLALREFGDRPRPPVHGPLLFRRATACRCAAATICCRWTPTSRARTRWPSGARPGRGDGEARLGEEPGEHRDPRRLPQQSVRHAPAGERQGPRAGRCAARHAASPSPPRRAPRPPTARAQRPLHAAPGARDRRSPARRSRKCSRRCAPACARNRRARRSRGRARRSRAPSCSARRPPRRAQAGRRRGRLPKAAAARAVAASARMLRGRAARVRGRRHTGTTAS